MNPQKKANALRLASSFSHRTDFRRAHNTEYMYAYLNGFLDEICSHMTRKTKWTKDSLREIAIGYANKTAFRKENNGAYQTAYNMGIVNDICSHMKREIKWTREALNEEGAKYCSKTEFREFNASAYQTAYRLGILNDIVTPFTWVRNTVLHAARMSSSFDDFCTNQPAAFMAGVDLNMIDGIRSDIFGID